MNKKTYNKPEIRERKRVIVTTMICQSPGEVKTLQIRKKGNKEDADANTQETLYNPWEAD